MARGLDGWSGKGAVAFSSVGPKTAVTGTPAAEAMCIAPESLERNARHRVITPARAVRSVRPTRFGDVGAGRDIP